LTALAAHTALSTDSWLARDEAVLAGVLSRVFDVVAVSGDGAWLTDVEGRRYLDFTTGIGVTSTGHCHPHVVAAVTAQAEALLHTSVVTHNTRSVEAAERLAALVPFMARPQVFFANSGAEVVDGALKLARQVTGRPGVIAFRRAFHGRTLAATSLTTAKGRYRQGYEPLLPSVHVAPYPYPLHDGGDAAATSKALGALDDVLALQAPAVNIGAMIVEPVLGEGGYVVPPRAWLQGLRERCDAHGILLVFDEVQCGMGRTGRPFAAETFGVRPDVLLAAKALASGMPLAAIVAPQDLMQRWPTASHGSTFGGNPVSCAAAIATVDVLEAGDLFTRCQALGRRMRDRITAAASGRSAVREVRGVGLMIGIELAAADDAETVQQRCFEQGMLVLCCGSAENVVRLIPPLTLTDDEADEGTRILCDAIMAV